MGLHRGPRRADRARMEGPFRASELERAVKQATG